MCAYLESFINDVECSFKNRKLKRKQILKVKMHKKKIYIMKKTV